LNKQQNPQDDSAGTKESGRPSIGSVIQTGIDWLRVDHLEQAERCFRDALLLQDDHPDACHLLAVALLRQNRDVDLAIQFIDKALASLPNQPIFLNSLGTAMWQCGRVEEARDLFYRVISLKPDYVEAQYNLGNAFKMLQQFDKAIAQYQAAIDLDPGYVNAYNDLGLVYLKNERYQQAIEHFNLALELDPARYELHVNLANSLQSFGELDAALISIHNALALSPGDAKMYNNLGSIYNQQGNVTDAIHALRQAIELDPQLSEALYNLGYLLHEQGEYDESLRMFDAVLSVAPDWAAAWVNRGNTLFSLHRYDDAIAGFEKAADLQPGLVVAYMNIATAYRRLCNLEKSMDYYGKALTLRPGDAKSHFGKALVLLKSGRFDAGWRHYEWRFEATKGHYTGALDLAHPEWTGAPFREKTLLVRGEQGLGDIIHFVRYLSLVKPLGGRVVLTGSPLLKRLLGNTPGIDKFIGYDEPEVSEFDFHVPLLSLPRIFCANLNSIPGTVPYVSADELEVENWRRRLDSTQFNVGLAWAGNPDQAENRHRSCPLTALAPLGRIEGATFYSLQKGDGADQLENPPEGLRLIDYTEELGDLADTAALMKALDLVITIDTAPAHLAGALAKPVWTMLWFAHCWRYLQDREDSPWYPTMRLFRQPRIGDWDSVVSRVAEALKERIARG